MEWLVGGLRPASGQVYSVQMMIKPVWIVMGAPMVRSFGPGKRNQLPLRLKLKRFDQAVVSEE